MFVLKTKVLKRFKTTNNDRKNNFLNKMIFLFLIMSNQLNVYIDVRR